MPGPDFDRLVEHGFLPDPDSEPGVVEAPVEVRRELGHVTDMLDNSTSEKDVRGVNQYGQPKTLPIPVITREQIEGGL